jgi:hypothetical protein
MSEAIPLIMSFSVALVTGSAFAAIMRVRHGRSCHFCAGRLSWAYDTRRAPWYTGPILAIYLVCMIFALDNTRWHLVTYVLVPIALVLCAIGTIRRIVKERPQFSISNLFALTAFVACVCSACHYVPAIPLIVLLAAPTIEWTKNRQCRNRRDRMDAAGEAVDDAPPESMRVMRIRVHRSNWFAIILAAVVVLGTLLWALIWSP